MSSEPTVGGDILRLVTTGMYDNPLVLFREYLQNAADSIASRGQGSGSVQIDIDPLEARLTITDDGPGLSPADAVSRLVPIGNSAKDPNLDRGLRGVGRLSSLAFAENVHFTTRTRASEPVTRVSWSGRALRHSRLRELDAATAIKECKTIHSLPDGDWPDQFFQVTVENVMRHAASTLLNPDAVTHYISQVCPVPMSPDFPLAAEVRGFLSAHTRHFVLDVCLGSDDEPIQRPFGEGIPLTDSYAAGYQSLEKRIIPRLDGDEPAAVLWLAHTPYTGSIPRHLGVRGLRARSGNIQIGADDVFAHLFHETRFNGWCVGEVHITDSRILPNGRRDYFEPGPHLRNLENHIGSIAHEISVRCRRASSHRNRLRQVETAMNQATRALDLARSGYLRPEDAAVLLDRTRERIPLIQQTLGELQITPSHFGHDDFFLTHCEFELSNSFPPLGLCVSREGVSALQSAFAAITDLVPPDAAMSMIETILHRMADPEPSIDPPQV